MMVTSSSPHPWGWMKESSVARQTLPWKKLWRGGDRDVMSFEEHSYLPLQDLKQGSQDSSFLGVKQKGKRKSQIWYLWPVRSRAVVLNWGWYWAPWDMRQCLEIVWVVAPAGRAWGRPWGRCTGSSHRTKNCSQLVNSVEAENPWLRVAQTFWGSRTCSEEVLIVILGLLLRWKRMPTDRSPVLQLPPVSAMEDGPPHSPGTVRDAPDSRLVMQGCQEIRHPKESCKSCKDRGLERLLYGFGKPDSWREKTTTKEERPQTDLDWVLRQEPQPQHLTWQRQREGQGFG